MRGGKERVRASSTPAPLETGLEGAENGAKSPQREFESELVEIRKVVQKAGGAVIEAYQADGWRGGSREKVQLVAELERARAKMEEHGDSIRNLLKAISESGGDKQIDLRLYDADGEIGAEDIFCCRCLSFQSSENNDIILCDGPCNRAYHQRCVKPEVDETALKEESWLCPACSAKDEAVALINDVFGSDYDLETPWSDFFSGKHSESAFRAPAVAAAGENSPCLLTADLPSSDNEDEDYDAKADGLSDSENEASRAGCGGESELSEDSGAEPSDSSEIDEEIDEEEELRSLRDDLKQQDQEIAALLGESEDCLVLDSKRKRTKVDYRALNQEMFGDVESYEGEYGDDTEWDPEAKSPKRGKTATRPRKTRSSSEK
eukprot:CAMPEP_0177588674 /NCGR_PEP_ID=MMETSP0419_2-20121207/6356_1 /TAXON_ID=582737 /ORGANISM="Tetraselmis sp., Strain GSL018" /LENGTH=376 /DNA_ID=CAMNT_0019078897 /DNA_START=287 /DNA_END=1418 /DNA_ORIENTATION=-